VPDEVDLVVPRERLVELGKAFAPPGQEDAGASAAVAVKVLVAHRRLLLLIWAMPFLNWVLLRPSCKREAEVSTLSGLSAASATPRS
jgi:hypothetical protein